MMKEAYRAYNITCVDGNSVYTNCCVWDTKFQPEQIEAIKREGVWIDPDDGCEYVFGEDND